MSLKKGVSIAVLLLSALNGDEEFLSRFEYGQMLYANPRGIACASCHGKKGEGGVIATYFERKKESNVKRKRTLYAPDIRSLPFQRFYLPFSNRSKKHGIMPTYSLTKKEIKAIYDYITEKESR